MRRIDPLQQTTFMDPFDFLGPKRKELLENGWAGLFRKTLLEQIPVEEIKSRFHAQMGRPSKKLRRMLGFILLQQMFDLTDENAIRQLAFNTEWHYALNLHSEEDDAKYICERTLRTYRALMIELELDRVLFRLFTDTLLDKFNILTGKQRLDSTHIRSNMRRLSRLELFRKTIQKFLKVMQREHGRLLTKKVESELIERYLGEKRGYFSQVKPSEAKERLQQAAEDLLVLVETFQKHPKIKKLETFALLQRLLEEQCHVSGEADEAKIELKDPKEVSSESMQNPSDPDAGYSGHKGEGYQLQVMETYQEDSEEEGSAQLNLITYIDVEAANCSDSEAVVPAIEESSEVTACPAGEAPEEIHRGKDGELKFYFDSTSCEACEHRDYCCVGLNAENKLEYSPKQLRLSQRRVAEESDEFREKYRWRSGVEAVNAKLKQMTGIGRLRVRGLEKVRLAVTLKVLGWNIFQAARA